MKWWELAIMQQGRVEYFLLLFKTPSNYRKLVYNKNKNVPKSHAMHTLSIENGMNGAWPMKADALSSDPVCNSKGWCRKGSLSTDVYFLLRVIFFWSARVMREQNWKKQKGPLVKLQTKATRIFFTFTVTLYYIYTYSYCSVLITCSSETLSQNCDQVCYILQRTISAKTSYCILKNIYNYILISPQIICSYLFSSRAKYIFSLASK